MYITFGRRENSSQSSFKGGFGSLLFKRSINVILYLDRYDEVKDKGAISTHWKWQQVWLLRSNAQGSYSICSAWRARHKRDLPTYDFLSKRTFTAATRKFQGDGVPFSLNLTHEGGTKENCRDDDNLSLPSMITLSRSETAVNLTRRLCNKNKKVECEYWQRRGERHSENWYCDTGE